MKNFENARFLEKRRFRGLLWSFIGKIATIRFFLRANIPVKGLNFDGRLRNNPFLGQISNLEEGKPLAFSPIKQKVVKSQK